MGWTLVDILDWVGKHPEGCPVLLSFRGVYAWRPFLKTLVRWALVGLEKDGGGFSFASDGV